MIVAYMDCMHDTLMLNAIYLRNTQVFYQEIFSNNLLL